MAKYAIALGMFDGVHIGHQAVLKSAIDSGLISLAVTFNTLPFKSGGSIMSRDDKEKAIKDLGVSKVHFLDFEEVKDLEPKEFLDKLCQKYEVGKIVCGFNYRFGKKASGDTAFLKNYAQQRNIIFDEIPPVTQNGVPVSSTLIKELLKNGQVEKAAELTKKPFSFSGVVEGGDKRGRTIGFPTINQVYPSSLAPVKSGVYQTVITVDEKRYNGVTNIGVRPTYPKDYVTAETYIIDFNEDCYGKLVKIEIIKYLREEKRFSSIDKLKEAIAENAQYVKDHSML